MGDRRKFRPGSVEALEQRAVLSHLVPTPRGARATPAWLAQRTALSAPRAVPALSRAAAIPAGPLPDIQISPNGKDVVLTGTITVPVLIIRAGPAYGRWNAFFLAAPGLNKPGELQAIQQGVPHVGGAITSGVTIVKGIGQWGGLYVYTPQGMIYLNLTGAIIDNVPPANQPLPPTLSYQVMTDTGIYAGLSGGGSMSVTLQTADGTPVTQVPGPTYEPGTVTLTFIPPASN